jgi:hypothetical protein
MCSISSTCLSQFFERREARWAWGLRPADADDTGDASTVGDRVTTLGQELCPFDARMMLCYQPRRQSTLKTS